MIFIQIPSKKLNSSTWFINGTFLSSTTSGLSGLKSNGSEDLFHISQTPKLILKFGKYRINLLSYAIR